MGLFKGLREDRSRLLPTSPYPAADRENFFPIPGLNQAPVLDEQGALAVPAVYACVSIIANNIASLPVDVYRKTKGQREELSTPTWLAQPNPSMTPREFWFRVVASLLLHGNAYILTLRNDKGQPVELHPIHPDRVAVTLSPLGQKFFKVDDNEALFDANEILHIVGFITPDAMTGLGPISAARHTLAMGKEAEKFGADFYKNGLHLTGVIEHPANATADELERLRATFAANHSGKRGASAIGVLSGGATWKSITLSPQDAQFIETRRFTATQIASIFHVPAYLLDPSVTSTWGSGIAEQNANFVRMTLTPWIVAIEQAISAQLLVNGQYMKFIVSALLRGTPTERAEFYHKGITDGWLTRNEARALEDRDLLPGLDEPLVMTNMATAGDWKAKAQAEVAQLEANSNEGGS